MSARRLRWRWRLPPAQLEEFHHAAEEIRITHKTLLELRSRSRPRRQLRSCRPVRPTSRSWRCSPRPTARCGHGRCAKPWTCSDRPHHRQQHPPEAQAARRARDPGRYRAGLIHPATAASRPAPLPAHPDEGANQTSSHVSPSQWRLIASVLGVCDRDRSPVSCCGSGHWWRRIVVGKVGGEVAEVSPGFGGAVHSDGAPERQ